MFDITALGEILIDFTPQKNNSGNNIFIQNAGGAPANLLAAASAAGAKTAFIGKVGNDMFGRFLKSELESFDISTSGLIFDTVHNTTLAFVSLKNDGDREFDFYRRFGADIFLSPDDINTELIKNTEIFHFGSLSLTNEPSRSATDYALSAAKESGRIISFDPNYRSMLWESEETAASVIRKYICYADIVKLSAEEAFMITNKKSISDAADELMNFGMKILLITDGANGSYCKTDIFFTHVPSVKANTVDTTGAGDIFFGTFLAEFLKCGKCMTKAALTECVRTAASAAGISTEKYGGISSVSRKGETVL